MKSAGLLIAAALCGCADTRSQPDHLTPATPPLLMADQRADGAVLPADTAERVTTEAGLTFIVRYPRRAVLGGPVPVTATLVNLAGQPAHVRGIERIHVVRPAVWFNPTGKAPYTALGERRLGNRENTLRFEGAIRPGEVWSLTFDVTDYYQLPIAHEYDLHLSAQLEVDNVDAGPGQPRRRTRRFHVGGLLIDVKAPDPKKE